MSQSVDGSWEWDVDVSKAKLRHVRRGKGPRQSGQLAFLNVGLRTEIGKVLIKQEFSRFCSASGFETNNIPLQ